MRTISPNAVTFEKIKDATGYNIRIKIPDGDRQEIKDIAQKHNFTVEEEKDCIIISKSSFNILH